MKACGCRAGMRWETYAVGISERGSLMQCKERREEGLKKAENRCGGKWAPKGGMNLIYREETESDHKLSQSVFSNVAMRAPGCEKGLCLVGIVLVVSHRRGENKQHDMQWAILTWRKA